MKRAASVCLPVVLVLTACVGEISSVGDGDGPSGGNPPNGTACLTSGGVALVHAPLRRLNRFEYDRTLRDLLGIQSDPAADFPADQKLDGFDNQAAPQEVPTLLADYYFDAAESLAADAVGSLPSLLPCDPAADGELACAQQFIGDFGKRAYRRPLEADERARYETLFQAGSASGGFAKGIEWVLHAMLQSPGFLYRVEHGELQPGASDAAPVPLTPYELASRLSYFVWGSMPDAELFAAADEDRLRSDAEIETQARRMLADPRARDVVSRFFEQWLEVEEIELAIKDGTTYPEYHSSLASSWRRELDQLVSHVVFDGSGSLRTLLSSSESFVDAELAALYGAPAPATGFARVTLDPNQRAGLLTTGAFLAMHANPNQSSPVLRGKIVRERLLCQELQPPPGTIEVNPPAPDPTLTTREQYAMHSEDPTCAHCHDLIDPIGFGFEHYDGIGRYRTTENGKPVDASGALTHTEDSDGAFTGAVELSHRLSESGEVRACFAAQWFRFAHARGAAPEEACALDELSAAFDDSGSNVQELVVAIVLQPGFRTLLRDPS